MDRKKKFSKSYKLNGLSLRMHGNRKWKPWNAVKFANVQKCHYRKEIQRENVENRTVASLCHSLNHAQQVHYASNPQQPGPNYFKVKYLACAMRGIARK